MCRGTSLASCRLRRQCKIILTTRSRVGSSADLELTPAHRASSKTLLIHRSRFQLMRADLRSNLGVRRVMAGVAVASSMTIAKSRSFRRRYPTRSLRAHLRFMKIHTTHLGKRRLQLTSFTSLSRHRLSHWATRQGSII
jgi:hypothetical protein